MAEVPITPHDCRLRDLTYAAPCYVDLRYVRGALHMFNLLLLAVRVSGGMHVLLLLLLLFVRVCVCVCVECVRARVLGPL
jgi:hypothetical protein